MKKRKSNLIARRARSGYLFLLPVILGLVFIFLPALVNSLWYSFNNVTIGLGSIETEFVGLKNFKDAFVSDPDYVTLLISASKGIFFDTAVIILFSFFMSNVLNQKFIGRGLARMVFFMPVVLSVGIVADLEASNELYNAASIVEEGTGTAFDQLGMQAYFQAGRLLQIMGLPAAMTSIIKTISDTMHTILNASGVQILIFLSALQAINPSVFEAAKMEGASKWEEFWKITFPMLLPSVLVCVVYTVISTFTNPTYGVMDFIQQKAFRKGQMGYASALSWIYFVIVLVVLGVTTGIISKRVTYLED